MSTLDVLQDELNRQRAGAPHTLRLLPGLATDEVAAFEKALGHPLPPDILALVTFTRGFEFEPFGEVLFTSPTFGLEQVFSVSVPLATERDSNTWVLDIRRDTGEWGQAYFASHDPPVVVVQAPSLEAFVTQILSAGEHAVDLKQEAALRAQRIWTDDSNLLEREALLSSADTTLRDVASALPENYRVVDLRHAEPGTGFAWARNGPECRIMRPLPDPVFGIDPYRSLLRRIFGFR